MRTVNRAAASLIRPVAVTADAVAPRRHLTVLGWHRIDEGPTGLSTSFDSFRRHLDVLEDWGAHVLPLAEAARLLAADRLPPRAVVLTFDDGYASVLEQAWPELRARQLPATLYVITGYVDGRARLPWDRHHAAVDHSADLATAAMIQEAVATGLDVGCHTATHPWLPTAAPDRVEEEVTASRTALHELTGVAVTSFAYPAGGWSPAVRAAVERAGYQTAVTCDRGRNPAGQDPLTLRRAFAFERPRDFRMQLEGAFTWMRLIEDRRLRRRTR